MAAWNQKKTGCCEESRISPTTRHRWRGVSIGADAVIGAASVVTKDMPAGHFHYGNLCRVIREIRN
jgi:bifunctional N-acetylglucosamine-1-phosphate-uridyltransferase/glucosamine-1-phosphate-acetyltransferase GlmU-like protein